jgi:hypothetical protein
MAIELVNGYLCRDCADVEKAKKGVDPAAGPNSEAGRSKTDVPVPGNDDGVNRPLKSGAVGTILNILA